MNNQPDQAIVIPGRNKRLMMLDDIAQYIDALRDRQRLGKSGQPGRKVIHRQQRTGQEQQHILDQIRQGLGLLKKQGCTP